MFKNSLTLYPDNIYMNLDFEKVKMKLKSDKKNIEDYGSLICISNYDSMIMINDLCKLNIYYNDSKLVKREVDDITSIINEQIKPFKYIEKFNS
ncbi:hypothetical protein [Clostridium intestinale]|uniref:Uncharacterized protein n=1 Tax=Clostridium intestinale URNW TaxID=1294142 RepID=U2PZA4_9CLOT|nr:hypothetical protein [Clostridium intestinale]ERK31850.1 hypothetical protein CINTURNW_1054 [Clostridium intestinale URNW]